MRFAHCTLDDVHDAVGTVVVIDVLRAFTTAAVALAQQPASYRLVSTLEQAFAAKAADTDVLLVGEVDGRRPEGFDLSNSAVEMASASVAGRDLVHRSSAGTQGVVLAAGADEVLVASLAVASATATAVRDRAGVTFCITGRHSGRDGDEDLACADLIAATLTRDRPVDPTPYIRRVRESTAGLMFTDPDLPWLPVADLSDATVVDRFGFSMQVQARSGALLLRAVTCEG